MSVSAAVPNKRINDVQSVLCASANCSAGRALRVLGQDGVDGGGSLPMVMALRIAIRSWSLVRASE
jgi:hypothetical protein